MLGESLESVTADDMQDVLGELTNMIAGNFKALLSGACHLSMPTVVEGIDYKLIVPGSKLITQVALDCQGQPFMVTLLERNEE